jgi:formylglycine-generating enzyme required for sulfatase activity
LVPGGTFKRSYDGVPYPLVVGLDVYNNDFVDPNYPATVADFYLDKYEITIGRFRRFVDAGMGTQVNPPAAGAGAHPLIAGSGWDPAWNAQLPGNLETPVLFMKAMGGDACGWTDVPGSNENLPVHCLSWYLAFAFCAWDGGRLPTEAEWNYAAAGGSEQRYYPWSVPSTSTILDDSYAVYMDNTAEDPLIPENVGSTSPKGDGKWGHADLAGNVSEWVLDFEAQREPMPCVNCAYLIPSGERDTRGGSWYTNDVRVSTRGSDLVDPGWVRETEGARCARDSL